MQLTDLQHYIICSYIDKIDNCTNERDNIDKKLNKEIEKRYPTEKEILTSIPGVADVVSNAFLSEIFRLKERFSDKDQLAQYCGAAPIIRESGEKSGKVNGYLTSICNVHIQPLLVQAAWSFMRKDEIARSLYMRKIANGKASGTAIMSVVKKLVSLIYSLIKNNRKYEVRTLA